MKDPVSKKSRYQRPLGWFSVMIFHPLCRGFGFVTFKDPQTVRKVLDAHNSTPISIDEKTVSLHACMVACRVGGGCC